MVRFLKPKRSSANISGPFLLTLPLLGFAFPLPQAQAQPRLISPGKKSFKPLGPEQKAAVDKILAIARVQDTCALKLDLKMENATLDDVLAAIKKTLPGKNFAVEVRDAKPIRVSFDLKDAKVGKLLTTIATLATCRLYVFSTGLVIAPADKLTEAETRDLRQDRGGEWATCTSAYSSQDWGLKPALDPPTLKQKAFEAFSTSLEIKVENATLDDVLAAIKKRLGEQSVPVEVRGASPIQTSFELKGLNIGNMLTPVAALAGCNVYVLRGGVLLSPPSQLTEAEKLELKKTDAGIWENNVDAGALFTGGYVVDGMRHTGWNLQKESRRLFGSLIAQEVAGDTTNPKPTVAANKNFGDFSPDAQAMLQQMVDWIIDGSRAANPDIPSLHLGSNSKISINASPKAIRFDFSGDISDKKAPKIAAIDFLK